MTGSVGEVEPDVNESFPISWAQKRDMILQLFQGGNEDVMNVLRHPENAGLIALIIGVPELYIPGDDDRNKQLVEIGELILGEPQPTLPPMPPQAPPQEGMGPVGPPAPPPTAPAEGAPPEQGGMPAQPMMVSSVQVEETLDNHEVEMITCQAWLKSEVGLQYKKENPGAYLNVLLHMQEHQRFVQMAEAAAAEAEAQGSEKQPPQE